MHGKVLVVDNHPIMLRFMRNLIEKNGYQVETANNGLEALGHIKETLFDIIFIDLIMPYIDGEKLCRIIRSHSKYQDVCLVILSAIAAEEQMDISVFGANACIAKGPFNQISTNVNELLEKFRIGEFDYFSKEIHGIKQVHQREITKELLSSKRRYEAIINNMAEGIVEINDNGLILSANPMAVAIIGIEEEKLITMKLMDIMVSNCNYCLDQLIEDTKDISKAHQISLNGKKISMDIVPIIYDDTRSTMIILNDLTEHAKNQDRLRRLSSELILVEEQERRRIANDLHDQIGQTLAMTKMKIGVIKNAEQIEQNECLGEIYNLIDRTIKDTRTLIFEISPTVLYEFGLFAGIEWLSDQIKAQNDIDIRIKKKGEINALSHSTNVFLFRAIRELLLNTIKHAQASCVDIMLKQESEYIKIEVTDNGIGFNTVEIHPYKINNGGFGLFNIRERLENLGGQLIIESNPGVGSFFQILAPRAISIHGHAN